MRLSEVKNVLRELNELVFLLPDGAQVPSHFHVTEIGSVEKNFIDCGGTVRKEKKISFQLWYSDDKDHRLQTAKLLNIISMSEELLGIEDHEIEVEYQSDTIGKYGLDFNNGKFVLTPTQTDCLAPDKCEIPASKVKINLSQLQNSGNTCDPKKGCC